MPFVLRPNNAHLIEERADTLGEMISKVPVSDRSEVLLQQAKDPQHPLHPYFEWDDEVAAEKYRLGQQAELLKACEAEIEAWEHSPLRGLVNLLQRAQALSQEIHAQRDELLKQFGQDRHR